MIEIYFGSVSWGCGPDDVSMLCFRKREACTGNSPELLKSSNTFRTMACKIKQFKIYIDLLTPWVNTEVMFDGSDTAGVPTELFFLFFVAMAGGCYAPPVV